MIHIKTSSEIEKMREGGKILSDVLLSLMDELKPGVSEIEIDSMAKSRIEKRGGEPGFMRVKGYRHTICVSTNDTIVHGIPTEYRFKPGDVVGIDCGVFYKGLHTDMSETRIIAGGQEKNKVQHFLDAGKE